MATAGSAPETSPRTIRKSPAGQIPNTSPGNTGELSRPAEAWTSAILSANSRAGVKATTAIAIRITTPTARVSLWAASPSRTAPQSTGLRPAISSSTSQSGTASANQASPGALKVNTLAAASSRQTATTERHGGRPAASPAGIALWSASAKARQKSAIAVSLKALWARNEAARYGSPVSAAIAIRRTGGNPASAPSAVSPVSAGIASRRPLKASTRLAPVTSAAITATACGPTG